MGGGDDEAEDAIVGRNWFAFESLRLRERLFWRERGVMMYRYGWLLRTANLISTSGRDGVAVISEAGPYYYYQLAS